MTSTSGNESQDKVLEAYFELGANLPVEFGSLEYGRLRDIASEVSNALVAVDAGEAELLRKRVTALAIVSSAVDHFPVLVNRPDLADNPDVDRVLVELLEAGVTELDPFIEAQDSTKFDESDDPVSIMLQGLKGAVEKARQYNYDVITGTDNSETDLIEPEFDESVADLISIEDMPRDGQQDEVSDDDEIDGSSF